MRRSSFFHALMRVVSRAAAGLGLACLFVLLALIILLLTHTAPALAGWIPLTDFAAMLAFLCLSSFADELSE